MTSPTVRADFFGLAPALRPEFAHRIDDAALDRLEAVAEEGQGAVEHHVHRVVEVGALGVFAQRDLLETVEGGADGIGHAESGSGGASMREIAQF